LIALNGENGFTWPTYRVGIKDFVAVLRKVMNSEYWSN